MKRPFRFPSPSRRPVAPSESAARTASVVRRLRHTFDILLVVLLLAACGHQALPAPVDPDQPTGQATVVLPGHADPVTVTYDVVGEVAIFEGDIILGAVDARGRLLDSDGRPIAPQGIAIDGSSYRWPGGIIPYFIDGTVSPAGTANIEAAIAEWEDRTVIDFVRRFTAPGPNADHVRFAAGSDSGSCSSAVGRQGGRQFIRLTPSGTCATSTLIHEIGHAVGLWHEQSRSDRNEHITVLWTNIVEDRKHNFDIHLYDGIDLRPYDAASIMHYGCTAFSRNGLPTLKPLDPDVGCPGDGKAITLGSATALSDGDSATVAALYDPFTVINRHDSFCYGSEICEVADVNGDGFDDLVAFNPTHGDVWVALAQVSIWDTTFGNGRKWHDDFCVGDQICKVADMNGDGLADLVAFVRSSMAGSGAGDVWVAHSFGIGFGAPKKVHDSFCYGDEICEVGDVSGDGRADLIAFNRAVGDVWMAQSFSGGYTAGYKAHDSFCYGQEFCTLGDVNGDDRMDLVAFVRDSKPGSAGGDVFAALSTGTLFVTTLRLHQHFCTDAQQTCALADLNGDGRDDLVALLQGSASTSEPGLVMASFGQPSPFGSVVEMGPTYELHDVFCVVDEVCGTGDFNGDGRDDLVAFVRSAANGTADGDVFLAISRIGGAVQEYPW